MPLSTAATSPQASRPAPFSALLKAFARALPFWLQRFGVCSQNLEDAEQETWLLLWQDSANLPTDPKAARVEVLRRAARVAQRLRRHSRRREALVELSEEIDAADPQNLEAWLGARLLLLEALERLDQDAQALIVARFFEGRGNAELAAELGETEVVINQRAQRAREHLQNEIDLLLGKPKEEENRSAKSAVLPLGLFGCDPVDRAILRALIEAEGKIKPLVPPPPPASGVVPVVGSSAASVVGPVLGVLGAITAIAGVLLALLWPSSDLPRMQAEKLAPTSPAVFVGSIETSAATAVALTAPPTIALAVDAQPERKTANAARGTAKPKTEQSPTPDQLAKAIERAREVFDGVGPNRQP